MDVTPRPAPPAAPRRRNPAAVALLALVLIGGGFVVFNGLRSATLYYYNADEALEQKADLGDKRFRVQGTVTNQTTDGDVVVFDIEFNDKTIPVRHVGDPPELFREGIPVVLEGRWDGDVFASDRILIKHSSEYKERNPDRVSSDAP